MQSNTQVINARRSELARRFRDRNFVTTAIGKATREAVLNHKRAGNSIAEFRDGKVVIVRAADITVEEQTT